jgi:diaminopimelate epimerase
MPKLKFYKYQGAGNDFVIIDNRNAHFDRHNIQLVSFLCDRRFGIGADGLMLLENDPHSEFLMRYFNSDGREASMCGNGGRCIAAFAVHQKIVKNPLHFEFNAVDGLHEASYENGIVSLKMIDVTTIETRTGACFLNTGSPHHVAIVDQVEHINVVDRGKTIRYSAEYAPSGTNVNFVEIVSPQQLIVRTYERGVEDETLACGTGVVASAIAASLVNGQSHFKVHVRGGNLEVKFNRLSNSEFRHIFLIGPGTFVFEGTIDI